MKKCVKSIPQYWKAVYRDTYRIVAKLSWYVLISMKLYRYTPTEYILAISRNIMTSINPAQSKQCSNAAEGHSLRQMSGHCVCNIMNLSLIQIMSPSIIILKYCIFYIFFSNSPILSSSFLFKCDLFLWVWKKNQVYCTLSVSQSKLMGILTKENKEFCLFLM